MGRISYFSTVLAELGGMLAFISPLTGIPLAVALVFREFSLLLPMAAVPVLLFLLGTLLARIPRKKEEIRLSSAMCSVALVWLAFALVSTIPFILVLGMPFTDALFESMAGWTGTGFSLFHPISRIPETLLFWRTYMQWVGGMGVIALSITMAARGGLVQSSLFRADSRSERILPSVINTGKDIWAVYIFLTLIGIGIILISGIPLYDALTLSLSTISTGGFIPVQGGIQQARAGTGFVLPFEVQGAAVDDQRVGGDDEGTRVPFAVEAVAGRQVPPHRRHVNHAAVIQGMMFRPEDEVGVGTLS